MWDMTSVRCGEFYRSSLMFYQKYRYPASEQVSKPNSKTTLCTKQKFSLKKKNSMFSVHVCQTCDLSVRAKKNIPNKCSNTNLHVTQKTKIICDMRLWINWRLLWSVVTYFNQFIHLLTYWAVFSQSYYIFLLLDRKYMYVRTTRELQDLMDSKVKLE